MKRGKYSNPFGKGAIFITQTYHWGSNNYAIDINPYGAKAGSPVYAIADGEITTVSSAYGSYLVLTQPSGRRIFYVHIYKWLPRGTKVKAGQKICELAPSSVNGGYPIHLHLGLGKVAGKYPGIMDYFDRSLKFSTRYLSIKKLWFNSNGTLNWNKFNDYYYVAINPCQKYIDQVAAWKESANYYKEKYNEYKARYISKRNDYNEKVGELKTCNDNYELLEETAKELEGINKTQKDTIETLSDLVDKRDREIEKLENKLKDCGKTIVDAMIELIKKLWEIIKNLLKQIKSRVAQPPEDV